MVGEEERRERAGSAVRPRPAHSHPGSEGNERGDLLLIDLLNDRRRTTFERGIVDLIDKFFL